MILVDATFLTDLGILSVDTTARNKVSFFRGMEMTSETIRNFKRFYELATINGVSYGDEVSFYKAIGDFYSHPEVTDVVSFMNNATFDGVNPIGDFVTYYKGVASILDTDPDAQAYYDAIGSSDPLLLEAIDVVVTSYKSASMWDKYYWIAPIAIVSGQPQAPWVNMKNPSQVWDSSTLTYTENPTLGVVNPTAGYVNSEFHCSTDFDINDFRFSVMGSTNSYYTIGAWDNVTNGSNGALMLALSTNNFYVGKSPENLISTAVPGGTNYISINSSSNTLIEKYANGNFLANNTNAKAGVAPNLDFYLVASNKDGVTNGVPTVVKFNNCSMSFTPTQELLEYEMSMILESNIHKLQNADANLTRVCYTVGDSLTVGTGSTLSDGYRTKGSEYGLYFHKYYTEATSGYRTDEILSVHVPNIVAAYDGSRKDNLAIVMAGTNDIIQSIAEATIETNLDSIVSTLQAAGFTVIINTIPKNRIWADLSTEETKRLSINSYITGGSTGADYVADLQQTAIESGDVAYFSGDNLHLNDLGYDTIGEFIGNIVKIHAKTTL